jgi:hypothetical protein
MVDMRYDAEVADVFLFGGQFGDFAQFAFGRR